MATMRQDNYFVPRNHWDQRKRTYAENRHPKKLGIRGHRLQPSGLNLNYNHGDGVSCDEGC